MDKIKDKNTKEAKDAARLGLELLGGLNMFNQIKEPLIDEPKNNNEKIISSIIDTFMKRIEEKCKENANLSYLLIKEKDNCNELMNMIVNQQQNIYDLENKIKELKEKKAGAKPAKQTKKTSKNNKK